MHLLTIAPDSQILLESEFDFSEQAGVSWMGALYYSQDTIKLFVIAFLG
jgi:hypothetical protein